MHQKFDGGPGKKRADRENSDMLIHNCYDLQPAQIRKAAKAGGPGGAPKKSAEE